MKKTAASKFFLQLFRDSSKNVPAYKKFLRDHNIKPQHIRTIADFATLPLINKANYISKYPLSELCAKNDLRCCDMVSVSSGSTGKPTFWLRHQEDEKVAAERFAQIFWDNFSLQNVTTLAVICFPLGTWVGGMYTYNCCRHLSSQGHPLTMVTPGNNKTEILRVMQEFAGNFKQIILLGYPPFIKDVIDSGIAQGIDWQNHQLHFVFAGEVFSEEWRELIQQRVGISKPLTTTASIYGTADGGVLANETPLTILIRRHLAANPSLCQELFGESRLPTLAQYDPAVCYFEEHKRTLLFSMATAIPLIRYHINDQGGLFAFDDLLKILKSRGFDALMQAKRHKIKNISRLPFVYLFGRSNFALSYYGANIFPEQITIALEKAPIADWVTGKFVMELKEDQDKNRRFHVTVELSPGLIGNMNMTEQITAAIHRELVRLNSEFVNYVPEHFQIPHIVLLPHGDSHYFPVGVKHRYSR